MIQAFQLRGVDSIERPYQTSELLDVVGNALEVGVRLRTLDERLGSLCELAKYQKDRTRELQRLQAKALGSMLEAKLPFKRLGKAS